MKAVYDVIVIGGSAAGLQATLTLARALVSVLCIDSNQPCNRYAKESHNFLTNDGSNPLDIKRVSWDQVSKYPSVQLLNDKVEDISKDQNGSYVVKTSNNVETSSKRLIFASGMNDNIENTGIKNISKFWGNSIIPCPFCHGFEFAGLRTGVYYDNPMFFQMMLPTLHNWSSKITVICSEDVFSSLDSSTVEKLKEKQIKVAKGTIVEAKGENFLSSVILDNGSFVELDVLYIVPPATINNKDIITKLGIELDDFGLVKVDAQQNTNVPSVKAAGDLTIRMRALAVATGQGIMAGAMTCHDIFQEKWSAK